MEDNKAAPSVPPQGGFVVFHLVMISYVIGAFPGPCWTSTGPAGVSIYILILTTNHYCFFLLLFIIIIIINYYYQCCYFQYYLLLLLYPSRHTQTGIRKQANWYKFLYLNLPFLFFSCCAWLSYDGNTITLIPVWVLFCQFIQGEKKSLFVAKTL